MFLVASLMVVSVVYWISALLAETVLDSAEERSLPVVIRTSFGFFFSVLYFSAAWQIVSIKYAWIFGMLLLSLYSYGKYGPQFISVTVSRVRTNIREHFKYFFIFLVGANVFFAPMYIANNFGPFTEGGGDVSIYADVSHLLVSKNLTEYGRAGELSNISENLKKVFGINYEIADKGYRAIDASSLSPPLAEAPVNRILALETMATFIFAPYAAYYFLSGITNYHVYFGIQAFLYCIILVGIWFFFRIFGQKSGVLALLAILFSHGLISVFYNMYAAQAFSLAFSVLVLNALPHIRLNSWAGLRTYGVGIACLWSMYVHFLTIVFPLAASAWSNRFFNLFEKKEAATAKISNPGCYRKLSNFVSLAIFSGLLMLLLFAASKKSILFLHDLLTNVFSGEKNVFMGDQIAPFSLKWFSFLFGILSQQHYLPFAREYEWLNGVVLPGVGVGVCVLLLGGFLMLKIYRGDFCNKYQKGFFILYVLLIATIVPHVYLTQSSLYTQAKGAQNILIYFYVILLLPLAMGLSLGDENIVIKKLTKTLLTMFALFCLAIAVPRVVFGLKLAYGKDRALIIESSYFLEADKIKKSDAMPFVLFEPRKSADLYLSDQPFFGAKVVPTRHLVLQKLNFATRPVSANVVLASELIETEDIPHLWLLRAGKKEKWFTPRLFDYTWRAQRLVDKQEPDILLFGHDYERDFGERDLDLAANKTGKFSYLRNGAAMLYLPGGKEGSLEVTLEPRAEDSEGEDYEGMVKEVGDRLKKGEMGSNVAMATDGRFITLTSKFAAEDKPTLKTIARYGGRFWLNVRVNDKGL